MSARQCGALAAAIVVVLALFGVTTTADATGGGQPTSADRVLVLSVPTLSWQDLDDFDAPHLEGLLDESAIADLSVRGVTRRTTADDAYTTLNAGTRAEGTTSAALAFKVGDVHDGAPAAEEFARRTGVTPEGDEIFNFGIVSLLAANERLLFDAEVGALGGALDDGGVDRAVIANGDHPEGEDLELQREATVSLLDGRGIVTDGAIDAGMRAGIRREHKALVQKDPYTVSHALQFPQEPNQGSDRSREASVSACSSTINSVWHSLDLSPRANGKAPATRSQVGFASISQSTASTPAKAGQPSARHQR
jgi:hypothetical protein